MKLKEKKLGLRTITILTALMMTVGGLTGCKKKVNTETETGTKIESNSPLVSDSVVTLSMMMVDSPATPFNPNWDILKEIEKRTNVKLDVRAVPQSDYANKVKLVLASGDIPDIVTKVDNSIALTFGDSEVLLKFNDYLSKLPNYKKVVEKWQLADVINRGMTNANGELYSLTQFKESPRQPNAFLIREDLLKRFNMQVPKTVDELLAFLRKAKESGVKYGYSSRWNLWYTRQAFGSMFGLTGNAYQTHFNFKKDAYEFTYATPQYKNMMTFMNNLSKEGLLDPETFTQEDKVYEQKLINGDIAFTYYQIPGSITKIIPEGKKKNPDFNLIPILPPTAQEVPGNIAPASRLDVGNSLVIPASLKKDPKKLDMVLKFVDWLYYSDEGSLMAAIGVEGVNYKDAGNKYEWLDNRKTAANPGGVDIGKEFGYGIANSFSFRQFDKVLNTNSSEIENNYYGEVTKQNRIFDTTPSVAPDDDAANAEKIKILSATLVTFSEEMFARFATNNKDPQKEWDSYVAELKAKGMDEYIKDVNSRYQKQKGTKKQIDFTK